LENFEMKKSLIALAVLAASGAAMAQSSVTLYGWLDTYVGSIKTEGAPGSVTNTVLNGGAVNGNRWGIKGTEDLGGGLKANFNLQQGFSIDSGAASTPAGFKASTAGFNRQSWVGFSGDFGAVKLGRMTSVFDDVEGASDAVLDSSLSPMNSVFRTTSTGSSLIPNVVVSGYDKYLSNNIQYESPVMSGFKVSGSYALGEDKLPAATATNTADATSETNFAVTYVGGPLSGELAYQTSKTTLIGKSNKNFLRLGAAYVFGPAKVKGTYGKAGNVGNVSGADATEWQLGLDYSVSPTFTLTGSYAKSTDNSTQSTPALNGAGGLGEVSRNGVGIGGAYTLSKRTYLYGGFVTAKQTQSGSVDNKVSLFALGINSQF
jgi:predicted porin